MLPSWMFYMIAACLAAFLAGYIAAYMRDHWE